MIAKLKNIHPGEILLEEFLLPLNISQNKLARDSEGFWLGLQADYNLEEKKISLKIKLSKIKSLLSVDNIMGNTLKTGVIDFYQ